LEGEAEVLRKPAPMPLCGPQIPHDLISNPGCRGGKPATNRQNYDTADMDVNKHTRLEFGNSVLIWDRRDKPCVGIHKEAIRQRLSILNL
jgi:hypothetical protein